MGKDIHYHIRWSDWKLDWERFGSREEAEEVARELVLPGETFTLEPVDDRACTNCLGLYERILANEKVREADARQKCELLSKEAKLSQ